MEFLQPATSQELGWYNAWAWQQIKKQPLELFSVMSSEKSSWTASFVELWHEVWTQASAEHSSINDMVMHLSDRGIFSLGNDASSSSYARNLVFAILGWQTMLYRSELGSCSPAQLAIADETNGHRGQAHMCLQQIQSATRKPLHEFLLGYGVLLPCRNFSAMSSEEDKAAFKELKAVSSDSFNAYLLSEIGQITIKWTDSLACHLELDPSSNDLYVYRYPSFCGANLAPLKQDKPKRTIHACACPVAAKNAGSHWATISEVDDFLQEVLLSYRLLFGKNKAARRFFRSLQPFEGLPQELRDKSLLVICGQKRHQLSYNMKERDTCELVQDFPILRSRIVVLLRRLAIKRPRTWRELWNDKRDSANWHTFWAVLIIGGTGLLLAFIQVVLQIIQVCLQIRSP